MFSSTNAIYVSDDNFIYQNHVAISNWKSDLLFHHVLCLFVLQNRKSASLKTNKNAERGTTDEEVVKNVRDGQTKLER